MADHIHVALATNEAYASYCAATIRSLFCRAAAPAAMTAHVLTGGLQRQTADMVARAAYENGGTAAVHNVDLDRLSHLPTLPHITADTYSRIIAADLLPNVERFVYLDCDAVVCADIRDLHDANLNGHPVGGIPHRNTTLGHEFAARFGLNADSTRYVNAGVLVIDASAWRREAASQGMMAWMNANAGRLLYSDQDAINHHFQGRVAELPLRWNLESRHYHDRLKGVPADAEMRQALADPAIIHYTGPIKPWLFDADVPRREQYLEHLDAVRLGAGLPVVKRTRRLRNAASLAASVVRFRLGRIRRRLNGENGEAAYRHPLGA